MDEILNELHDYSLKWKRKGRTQLHAIITNKTVQLLIIKGTITVTYLEPMSFDITVDEAPALAELIQTVYNTYCPIEQDFEIAPKLIVWATK